MLGFCEQLLQQSSDFKITVLMKQPGLLLRNVAWMGAQHAGATRWAGSRARRQDLLLPSKAHGPKRPERTAASHATQRKV